MLATILKLKIAVEISIRIMDAFVEMRKYISNNLIEQRFINKLVLVHDKRIDMLEQTFSKFKEKNNHLFYEGQIYDAYSLMMKIFDMATNDIIIINDHAGRELFDLIKKYKQNNKNYYKKY